MKSLVPAAMLMVLSLATAAFCAEPPPASGADAKPQWVALWKDAYKENADPKFDPEKPMVVVFADRTSGDAFLCGWNMGVWKSSDGGKQFIRIDGGKITGPGCGPIMGYSAFVSPEGRKIAIFNMWNTQASSGYSLDGGASWEQFTNVGRDWDFGAMDWDSKTVLGARHEFDTLHLSTDDGKTWTKLDRSRSNPWVTGLGVVDAHTLLLATEKTIERSEDGGKTWAVVSDLGAIGPAQKFNGRLWWLSQRKSLIVSEDRGKTWSVKSEMASANDASPEGKAADGPWFGPLFGKDENHIVMVNNTGFHETTDGGKTWNLAAALPEGFAIGTGANSAAYDPVHDVFYISNRAHPVMKYVRHAALEYVVPTVAASDARGAAGPKADFVEIFAPRILRVLNVMGMDMNAGFLYVCTEDGLAYFKPDPNTGKLTLVDLLLEARSGGFNIACAGGRLYGVTPHDGYHRMSWHGLAWFDLDAQTGKPQKIGVVDCPASRQMIVGPDQKDLYLKACGGQQDKLFWYRIAADGKPAKAGEVTGKGIGASLNNDNPGLLRMTPDGKFIYAVSARDYAIACISRQPTGEIAYVSATDLDSVAKHDPENYKYQWISLNISPDNQWLYASIRNGKPTDNFYGIFKRDLQSGALTLQETCNGQQDALANLRAWDMVFSPRGSGGYLGSLIGPVMTFNYDSRTGRLTNPAAVRATDRLGSGRVLFDSADGTLFTGGGDYGIIPAGVSVLKVDRKISGNAQPQKMTQPAK